MELKQKLSVNYEKQTKELFAKQNPLSLNNKSIYFQDYLSICQHNWLRTQIISSLITIMQKKFQQKVQNLFSEEQVKSQTIENSNELNFKEQSFNLSNHYKKYIKIVDPFIVTMILFTHQDFILQTLQGLEMFDPRTKYIVFPMNSQIQKGSHWFLTIFTNPRYRPVKIESQGKNIKSENKINPQLFVINSISTPKNDSSLYMSNELGQQIKRLMNLFYPQESQPQKIFVKLIQNRSIQQNSYDCGIFTVAYIEQLIFGQVVQKQMQQIKNYRTWQDQCNLKAEVLTNLTQKSSFILNKSSAYLRNHYKRILEECIISQNADKQAQNQQKEKTK